MGLNGLSAVIIPSAARSLLRLAALKVSYSNFASSQVRRRAHQACQDSLLSSCGDGRLQRPAGSSSRRFAPATSRPWGSQSEGLPCSGQPWTGCSRIEWLPAARARKQMDSPFPVGEDHRRHRTKFPFRTAVFSSSQQGSLRAIRAFERQVCPQRPHSRHRMRSVLRPEGSGEVFCVLQR